MRRTALYGDGWLGIWCSPQRYAQALMEIADRAAEAGRSAPAHNGIQLWIGIDDDPARARARLAKAMEQFYRIPFERFEKYSPYGTAEVVAEALARYRDAGCRLFNLMPVAADPGDRHRRGSTDQEVARVKPGATGFKRIVDATGYTLKGFAAAWRNESAFRQESMLASYSPL